MENRQRPGFLCALAFTMGLVFTAPSAHAQDSNATQRAAVLHEQGVELFRAGRYREAILAFSEAEQHSPNQLNLYNQARCHQELGEYPAALSMLDRYIALPQISGRDRTEASRLRQEILAAAQAATPEPTPQPITAPQPAIGGQPAATPQPRLRVSTPVWVMIGITGAALVTGIVAGSLALSGQGDFDDLIANGEYGEAADLGGSVETRALVADISWGVAAAAAITGIVLFFVDYSRSRRAAASPSFAFSPSPTEGGGQLVLLGRF